MKKILLVFVSTVAVVSFFFWFGKNHLSKNDIQEILSSAKKTWHLAAPKVTGFVKDVPAKFDEFKKRADQVNRYESMSFKLLQENRDLKARMRQLSSKVSELKAQNKFFISQYGYRANRERIKGRFPAGYISAVDRKNDLVKFKTYKWEDKKLLQIARREWNRKNYVKSAQYYYTLIQNYPQSSLVNDQTFYETAITSLETGIYNEWAEYSLEKIIKEYPKSSHYREARLWMALIHFNQGDREKFYQTLEEFRLKYRNTKEWRVVRGYYKHESISDRL